MNSICLLLTTRYNRSVARVASGNTQNMVIENGRLKVETGAHLNGTNGYYSLTANKTYNIKVNVDKSQFTPPLEFSIWKGNSKKHSEFVANNKHIETLFTPTITGTYRFNFRLRQVGYNSGVQPFYIDNFTIIDVTNSNNIVNLGLFKPDVLSHNDYYPFGMLVPNRHASVDSYRYGFQGQEKDDEIKGEGNSLNYKFRMHDPRVGRFFAVDPLSPQYAHNSPYAFSENRVIDGIELEGLEYKATKDKKGNQTGFEWDPDNAYDDDGKLKKDYYNVAIFFNDKGTWKPGVWQKNKQRYSSKNIGSASATVYYSVEEMQSSVDAEGIVSTKFVTVSKTAIFNASTMPSDPTQFATVAPGLYNAVLWKHQGRYPALQMRSLTNIKDGNISIVGGVNPSNGSSSAVGVNIHTNNGNYTGTFWGKKKHTYRGFEKTIKKTGSYGGVSEACLLIDSHNWKQFMDIFPSGTSNIGVSVYRPLYTIPALNKPTHNPNIIKLFKWQVGINQKINEKKTRLSPPPVSSEIEGAPKN